MIAFSHIPMHNKTQVWRYVALISHVLLLLWVALWRFYFDDKQTYSFTFIVIFYLLPLVFPLLGIMKAKPYTHAWASFVVLIYLTHAITVLYAEPQQLWLAIIELMLASAMFTACCLFARYRGQECGLKLGKLKAVMEAEKSYFEGK